MNLLDNIKTSLANQSQPTPEVNQVEQAQALINAKSGQAGRSKTSTRLSNLGEQLAKHQTQLGMQQVQQTADKAAFELEGQQKQLEQQTQFNHAKITEQTAEMLDEMMQNSSALLRQFQTGDRELNINKDRARLEQAGILARLNNSEYMATLQREGARSRLNDDARFQEEMVRTVFSDEIDLLSNDLEFRSMMAADDRAFTRSLAMLDINQAIELATAQAQQASATQMWTGAGNMVGAGIAAYAAHKPATTDTPEPNESGTLTASGQYMSPGE